MRYEYGLGERRECEIVLNQPKWYLDFLKIIALWFKIWTYFYLIYQCSQNNCFDSSFKTYLHRKNFDFFLFLSYIHQLSLITLSLILFTFQISCNSSFIKVPVIYSCLKLYSFSIEYYSVINLRYFMRQGQIMELIN